ncbi:MAG: ATP-binding protein [Cellvibrionaceae bacterium]|nr:ATP-binding protein [Cellvibrionaceae bacterium]
MSFSTRLVLTTLLHGCLIGLGLLLGFVYYSEHPYWVMLAAPALLLLVLWSAIRQARAISRDMRSLEVALLNIRDANFSVSMPPAELPEMAGIVASMNSSFGELREQRQSIYQRELLLDTVIEASPVAMLLCDGAGHLIFANASARRLILDGRKHNGASLLPLLATVDQPLAQTFRDILQRGQETFFSVRQGGDNHSYHYANSHFSIDQRQHRLHLLKDVSRQINRQEADNWKKTIKIISHELNNSLAPISSLAHSCQLLLARKEYERLGTVLGRIETGVQSLHEFIQRYASFARLPLPQLEPLDWPSFMQQLHDHYKFERLSPVPHWALRADAGQLQQALLNLLKNAHESGSPATGIKLWVEKQGDCTRFTLSDQGKGMAPEVLEKALLPFYSTKPLGSGIGLALCREIVEAHHGQISLDNRESGLTVSILLPNL